MWKVLLVVSMFFGIAGIGAFIAALVFMNTYDGSTYFDVGAASLLISCFVGIWSLHMRMSAER
ncbi:MAG: hypothetical protein AB8F26_09465 [Phycisphaerales bacterium]